MQFEGFTLDPAARTLVGPGGREIPLRRSEYELLLAFIRARGRALGRDHLLEAVCGRRLAAYDRSVDVLVGRLRRKIEPDPKAPRLIVTVPGFGYRFIARVQTAEAAKSPPEPLAASPEIIHVAAGVRAVGRCILRFGAARLIRAEDRLAPADAWIPEDLSDRLRKISKV